MLRAKPRWSGPRRARKASERVDLIVQPQDGLGEGFIMEWLDGEALGARIARSPELAGVRANLAYECGQVLARIAQSPASGEIARDVWLPLEDLYEGENPAGQVGQEIYGAGEPSPAPPATDRLDSDECCRLEVVRGGMGFVHRPAADEQLAGHVGLRSLARLEAGARLDGFRVAGGRDEGPCMRSSRWPARFKPDDGTKDGGHFSRASDAARGFRRLRPIS